MLISSDRLRELLRFDPVTGLFTYVDGSPAGHRVATTNYITIYLDKRTYFAHRLAWLYVHGEWPPAEIDHINADRTDNRMNNLRSANRVQNTANTPVRSHKRSGGGKGVFLNKRSGKWYAQIKVSGETHNLGTFLSPDLASNAYMAAAVRFHGEFAKQA